MQILSIIGTIGTVVGILISLWNATKESKAQRELERQQLALEENRRSLETCHQWRSWQWAALGILGLVVVIFVVMPRSAA
jgi:hypothetical protein